jgi:hypothetical protein
LLKTTVIIKNLNGTNAKLVLIPQTCLKTNRGTLLKTVFLKKTKKEEKRVTAFCFQ